MSVRLILVAFVFSVINLMAGCKAPEGTFGDGITDKSSVEECLVLSRERTMLRSFRQGVYVNYDPGGELRKMIHKTAVSVVSAEQVAAHRGESLGVDECLVLIHILVAMEQLLGCNTTDLRRQLWEGSFGLRACYAPQEFYEKEMRTITARWAVTDTKSQ
ncbi:MAG: hypothetical protein BroJett014_28980 [Planctomycetota bacterium]|nr:hypothetical protein [Planctomycetota bacterium]GIK53925.1 MAG: hypothetical protein BroJett014_28980 [Planctomycetota bacterium]